MWELRVRVHNATEEPAAGYRIDASFDLRLAAGPLGDAMWMPAQASAQTGADGTATIQLPSAGTVAETIKLVVREPGGHVATEISRARSALVELPELLIQLDPELPPELEVRARVAGTSTPIARRELGLVARREGSSEFEVLLAGRTDEAGALRGPYPRGRFAEASAVVRLEANLTLPVRLDDGRLPTQLDLEVPLVVATTAALEARSPAPPPPEVAPPPAPPSPNDTDPEPMGEFQARLRDRPTIAGLGFALVLGTFLRFYHLGTPSLWSDELSTWRRTSYETLGKVFVNGIIPDNQPPGYYLLLTLVRQVFGDGEWALRLPSALAGVVAIVVIFLLGRRLWSDREGLIAAGLTAVLWAPIRYSQEARASGFLMPAALLATWAWYGVLRDLDHRGRIRGERLLAYVLLASALTYVHYTGLILVGLQLLTTLGYAASRRRRRSGLGAAMAVVGAVVALYLPWLGPFLDDLNDGKAWAATADDYAGAGLYGFTRFLFNDSTGLTAAALLLMAISAGLAIWRVQSGDEELRVRLRSPWLFCLLWLLVPFALMWIKSIVSTPMLSDRNLLICAPAVYLLVARAITALPVPGRAQEGIAGALVGFGLLGFIGTGYYEKPHRQQIREAVAWVVEASKDSPEAPIIGTGTASHWNYYFKRQEAPQRVELVGAEREVESLKARFKADGAPERAWLMRASSKPDEEFLRFFQRWMHEVRTKSYYGVDIVEYHKGATSADEAQAETSEAAGEATPDVELEDEALDEPLLDEPSAEPHPKKKAGDKAKKADKSKKKDRKSASDL